ncbi:MAG TPA: hypothetical protein VH440_08110 [Candidatus Limnocylindrales bacterium]|jgi:hypothetical protein
MTAVRRHRARGARAVLVSLLAVVAALALTPARTVLPAGAPGAVEGAAAATAGLTTTADARYVVDPAAKKVHVTVALAATNHLKDTKTRRYFFDRSYLAVPPGTTGFRISSAGASPRVSVTSRHKGYNLLRIDFGKQLAAGATRTFSIAFDIPDPGGAPTRATRIGTSLVSFSAWGLGSDGATGGSVTVIFPTGFTVLPSGTGLTKSRDAAGNTVFSTGRLANPLSYIASFSADRPSAYKESTIRVAIGTETVPVTIRSWPDDPAWTKRVGGLLAKGLPALAKDIGLPWRVDRQLVVQEAISRNTSGFSGRYSPGDGTIEIAYYADSFVVLHEAAHAWFDGGLLADRWANEGFASWYALRAARAIGEKQVVGDALTAALEKLRVPLNAWAPATPETGATPAEDAEYAAALRLASLAAERATPAGLQSVWRAIADQRASYQPSASGADLERGDGTPPDWRGLLDVLEEQTGGDYRDLWTAWVVRPAEAGLLADRAAARERYEAVSARAGDWRLPRVVRDVLRVWQYDQATELLDAASHALDDRDAVTMAATAAGLTVPTTMRTDFEGPRGFAAASAEADAELAAIAAYRDAAGARTGQTDVLERIGLWNASPDASLAQAAGSFASGDLEATVRDSAFAKLTWASAATVGRNRVLAVVGSLAALLLGAWLTFRWLRDRGRRRRRRVLMAHAEPSGRAR